MKPKRGAGKYNKRISISRRVLTVVNGEAVAEYIPLTECWAQVTPQSPRGVRRTGVLSGVEQEQSDYAVNTRWSAAIADVQAEDIVILKDQRQLRIVNPPRNVELAGVEAEIDCVYFQPVGGVA